MMISSGQIRAARAFLDWNQGDLAEHSGVSAPTIKRIELNGPETSSFSTVKNIILAFEGAGISFCKSGCICPSGAHCEKHSVRD